MKKEDIIFGLFLIGIGIAIYVVIKMIRKWDTTIKTTQV